MAASGGWAATATIISMAMVLLAAGCIAPGGDLDDDPPAVDVTLIIDFEGFDPDTFPDQRVEWELTGDDVWTEVKVDRPDGAYYVINDLTATDALDVLTAAAEATGVEIQYHVESQGAFVDSIDGIVNGRDGHYWSYYVENEYGLVAANDADLTDGDTVRWVYMGNPFG